MPGSSLPSPTPDRSHPSRNATAAQRRREELILHAQGGDGGYVEISPSETLRDVRKLILEQFDPEQLPLRSGGGEDAGPEQSDAEFAFRVNGVRISTKQECHKNALELWESRAKVELVPRKRRSIAAAVGDGDNRKVAKVGNITPFEPSLIGERRKETLSEENPNEEHTASSTEHEKETCNNEGGYERIVDVTPIELDTIFSVKKEKCTAAGDGSYSAATENFEPAVTAPLKEKKAKDKNDAMVVEGKPGDDGSNDSSNNERDIPSGISGMEKEYEHTNGVDVAMNMKKGQETEGNTNDTADSPKDVEEAVCVQRHEHSLIHKTEEAAKTRNIFDLTSKTEEEPSARRKQAAKFKSEKTLSPRSAASDENVDLCGPRNAIANIQQKFRASGVFDDLRIGPNTQFSNLRVYTVQYNSSGYGYTLISCNGRVVVKSRNDGKNLHPRIGAIVVGANGYLIPYRAPFQNVLKLMKYMKKTGPVTLIFAEDDHFTSLFLEDFLPNRPVTGPPLPLARSSCLPYPSTYQSQVQIPLDHTPTWGDILPKDYF